MLRRIRATECDRSMAQNKPNRITIRNREAIEKDQPGTPLNRPRGRPQLKKRKGTVGTRGRSRTYATTSPRLVYKSNHTRRIGVTATPTFTFYHVRKTY